VDLLSSFTPPEEKLPNLTGLPDKNMKNSQLTKRQL
jgi:hypothetical protein